VWIEFEPGDQEDLIFEEKIFGGSVPKNFHPALKRASGRAWRRAFWPDTPWCS
jgi:hypothetical protein